MSMVCCIRWDCVDHVRELYELLDLWTTPAPVEALQLLDRRFSDPVVRAYAVVSSPICSIILRNEHDTLYVALSGRLI
jgi:hypothetical protein